MPKLVNIDETRIIRCKDPYFYVGCKRIELIYQHLDLADPSAPSMGSVSSLNTETNFEDNRTNLTQSPITHETSYSPSPSASTSFNYTNVPSRSVPELQIPVSPKHQQQNSPQQPQQPQSQHQQMKPATPKQQSMPKPSVVIQQCMCVDNIYSK